MWFKKQTETRRRIWFAHCEWCGHFRICVYYTRSPLEDGSWHRGDTFCGKEKHMFWDFPMDQDPDPVPLYPLAEEEKVKEPPPWGA